MKTNTLISIQRHWSGAFIMRSAAVLAFSILSLPIPQAWGDGRIWVGTAVDNSFSAASSSSWIPGSVPTTNSDLWIGTATTYGGTNVVSTGTASTRSAMGAHGMIWNNNFNSSNSIVIGNYTTSGGYYPITMGWNQTNPVAPFIQSLTTNGTIRFQAGDPVTATTNTMRIVLNINANTNVLMDIANGGTVDIACQVIQSWF